MANSIKIQISGRVQGVFYRDSAKNKADELGLKGYVRNLNDGRVEVLVQGDKIQVQKFMVWCSDGSKLARVENIEPQKIDCEEFSDFSIRF